MKNYFIKLTESDGFELTLNIAAIAFYQKSDNVPTLIRLTNDWSIGVIETPGRISELIRAAQAEYTLCGPVSKGDYENMIGVKRD